MGRQQLLLKQELTIPQILRTYTKQFRQITEQYSNGYDGRCAMGAIYSYFSWDDGPDSDMTEYNGRSA
jgi:hypothetical protein